MSKPHRAAALAPVVVLAAAAALALAVPSAAAAGTRVAPAGAKARAGSQDAAPAPEASAAPGDAEPGARRDVVRLRFRWPAPSEAQVTYRRTRSLTGERPSVFVARYTAHVEREAGSLLVRTAGTRWDGDLPFPRAAADSAIRASEHVVQRVAADGEFEGLDHEDAMRPVLAALIGESLPPEQAERAIALGLAGMRADSEELWNLAVGFWTGAELEVGARYVMQGEAELPLVPGVRSASAIEFQVRRRVPCAATERALRCVEVTLRATPEPAAVERARAAIAARLAGGEPNAEEQPALPADVVLESELLLVTDPDTLLPRRMVWTKAIRAGAGDRGAPALERVDRSEYDYRYEPPAPARPPPAPKRRPKREPPPAPPAEATAPTAQR